MVKKFIRYPRYLFRKQLASALIKKYIPAGSRFLEIGCATGDFGIALAAQGYAGHLIDFSSDAAPFVEKAVRDNELPVSFECVDIFDMDSETQAYDFVVIFEVLEHIKDDAAVVKKIYSLLKPGGYLVLSVPARMKLWGTDDVGAGHFRRYEKDTLKQLLHTHNFVVRSLLSYGFPFMNLLKPLRIIAFRLLARRGTSFDEKEVQTKKSGVNIIRVPLMWLISNKYFLYPLIQFSRLFNNTDLGEGYLCVAQKKP